MLSFRRRNLSDMQTCYELLTTLNKSERKRQGKKETPSLLCAERRPIVVNQLRSLHSPVKIKALMAINSLMVAKDIPLLIPSWTGLGDHYPCCRYSRWNKGSFVSRTLFRLLGQNVKNTGRWCLQKSILRLRSW